MLEKERIKELICNGTKDKLKNEIKDVGLLSVEKYMTLSCEIDSEYEKLYAKINKMYNEACAKSDVEFNNNKQSSVYLFIDKELPFNFYFKNLDEAAMILPGIVRLNNLEQLVECYQGDYVISKEYLHIRDNLYAVSNDVFEEVWYTTFGHGHDWTQKFIFESGLVTFEEVVNCILRLKLPITVSYNRASGSTKVTKNVRLLWQLPTRTVDWKALSVFVKDVNEAKNFNEVKKVLFCDLGLNVEDDTVSKSYVRSKAKEAADIAKLLSSN